MGQPSFWSRLAERLGMKPGAPANPYGNPDLLREEFDDLETPPAGDGEEPKAGGTLMRWARRDQTLTKLQEGYEKVVGLIDDIQKHIANQDERTASMCRSLEQLASSLSDLPNLSRRQAQTLETISQQMSASVSSNQKLVEAVGQLPRTAQLQTESLGKISRQLELSGQQQSQIGSGISSLEQNAASQAELLRSLQAKAEENGRILQETLARQNKRLVILLVMTVIVAVAALAVALTAVLIR